MRHQILPPYILNNPRISINRDIVPYTSRADALRNITYESGAIILRRNVLLAGGGVSHWYLDCRRLMLNPSAGFLIGRHIASYMLKGAGNPDANGLRRDPASPPIRAIGGPATGAIPLVSSVAISSAAICMGSEEETGIDYRLALPLSGFYVRQAPKAHGASAGEFIEGDFPDDPNAPVAIVDDVVTTGGSILRALDAAEARGNPIAAVMCLLDRGEGGKEALRERGYELVSLMSIDEEE